MDNGSIEQSINESKYNDQIANQLAEKYCLDGHEIPEYAKGWWKRHQVTLKIKEAQKQREELKQKTLEGLTPEQRLGLGL